MRSDSHPLRGGWTNHVPYITIENRQDHSLYLNNVTYVLLPQSRPLFTIAANCTECEQRVAQMQNEISTDPATVELHCTGAGSSQRTGTDTRTV